MENHILIGLGGTGGKVLKEFRKRLFSEYREDERKKLPIGFVYVDSTDEMMKPNDITFRVQGQDASFTPSEFVNIKGIDLDSVFRNPNGYPGLKGFIGNPEVMQKTIGLVTAAAGQKRRAGRILFGGSVQSFIKTLRTQHTKVKGISTNSSVTIHIFTGLAGGTGSGSIIDTIAQVRKLFPKDKLEDKADGADVLVYSMVPEISIPEDCDAGRYHANGYAALTELSALLARKYMPHDVTGMSDRVNFTTKMIANGVFVYSNVNEHGKVMDSFKIMPKIVSDFAYSRIFIENNDNTKDFFTICRFENVNNNLCEKNEKSKEGEVDLVRSNSFGSFGIKRVIIPEQEIIEYFMYNFGRQALLQMRFNNWNDDLGYREIPANIDFNSFVKDAEQLERWRLTDKHLILDKPVLESDQKKWNSFADYWNYVIPLWTEQARTAKLPLNELEKYCNEGYEKGFRKVGVADFFENKTQAKEEHATEIADIIERYIFDKWGNGDFSLHNLTQLIDKIIENVGNKRREFEGKITTTNQVLDNLEMKRLNNQKEWVNVGVISGDILGRKKKIIQGHSMIMSQVYIKKTEIAGLNFGIALLASLSVKLNSLRSRIEKFVSTLNDAIIDFDKQIAARCKDKGTIEDLQEAIIRFYNHEAVVNFTRNIMTDKKRQENIASEFRQKFIAKIGKERTFTRANEEVDADIISQILETFIREKSISIHNETLISDGDKLINRNILEQLSEQYSNQDDLRAFAKDLIEKSGVFATFNYNEINRAVNNNPIPEIGISIYNKIVLINLPNIEGKEKVQRFANKFSEILKSCVSGVSVKVDTNGKNQNEITILSIVNNFPLRVLKDLPLLKEKYDFLTTNERSSLENRTILHTEGTGENFPNLFVMDELLPSDIRKKYVPYLIINEALGFVKYTDKEDGTGKSAWGTININRLGEEVLSPIADKFTEIAFNEIFTETFGEELKEKAEKEIKTDKWLHKDKRVELNKKVQNLYKEIILPEYNNNKGNENCKFYADCAEKAMDIIENI